MALPLSEEKYMNNNEILKGKKGLVIGIANDASIAYGCAKIFVQAGADIAITYLNDKAEKYVRPLAEDLGAEIISKLDVTNIEQMDDLFSEIQQKWGRLDFLVHSIAFAPKDDLQGRVIDCSLQGFLQAMDISCHSLLRLAKYAEPLMQDGGSIITMTYYGSEKTVENYNIMGPVKAALESSVRYMAYELGGKAIRVNAISPGPIRTRAASGIKDFERLAILAEQKSPEKHLVSIDDVGMMAAFLVSDYAKSITGNIHFVDAGYNIID